MEKQSPHSFDPGAARQGNFINYYEFNPAEKRIGLIPEDILLRHAANWGAEDGALIGLDIGCNTGVSR